MILPLSASQSAVSGVATCGLLDVQCKSRAAVTEHGGDCFYVHAALRRGRGEAVPLRYNYDKPGKPRISRAFGYLARFFILFRTEKSSREVVISQGVL